MNSDADTLLSKFKTKGLPLPPPLRSPLQAQNQELSKQNKILEEVIEDLYRQNLQYATLLNQYKAFETDANRYATHIAQVSEHHAASFRRKAFEIEATSYAAYIALVSQHHSSSFRQQYVRIWRSEMESAEHLAQISEHHAVSFRQQDLRMRRSEMQSKSDWKDYREDKPCGSAKVDSYLEDMKERLLDTILDQDCEDIVIGFKMSD